MTASVNRTTYSTGNLADLFWSFEQMISFASRGTELHAGDVIGALGSLESTVQPAQPLHAL
jgi:2-keto-4-pentenoate hydratase/2-oxohepta-3-ene-1,7-dioic acid hydratase in catechol pathway